MSFSTGQVKKRRYDRYRRGVLRSCWSMRFPTRTLLGLVVGALLLCGCNQAPDAALRAEAPAIPLATIETQNTPTLPQSASMPSTPEVQTGVQTQPVAPVEIPVQEIALAGPAASAQAEISGMAWFQDNLILLPQFPKRISTAGDGALLAIPRQRLLDYIQGKDTQPILPVEIPILTGGIEKEMLIFEGFEAIAFQDNRVYLAIEGRSGVNMMGYLVRGEVSADLSEIRLEAKSLTANPPQARQQNRTDEAILVAGGKLLTFFESNGAQANPGSYASVFDLNLQAQGKLDIPPVEYRLTDATPLDQHGNFWMINYFFPGDVDLIADHDPLAEEFGEGASHSQSEAVERLLEFHYSEQGIALTDTPPLLLQLDLKLGARNWEGIARLDEFGFLLVTDKHPGTILGFVATP